MKKRIILIGALFAIAVGVSLWLGIGHDEMIPETPATVKTGALQDLRREPTDSRPAQQTPAGQASTTQLQEQRREAVSGFAEAREREVEFWGKVIDQQGEAVPGVEVTATITTHQIPMPGSRPQPAAVYATTTDAAGLFYFKGRAGRGFTIETMQRAGYVLPPDLQKRVGNLFWYNYDQLDPKGFKPESSAPVVFHMWKLGQPERLVTQDRDIRIPYDGTAVRFDLLSGEQVASGGDLLVTLSRMPLQIRLGQQKYDWSATIEAVGGGVIPANDEFMFLAPGTGYEPKLIVSVSANDPHWSAEKKISLFLKSRAGKNYGRVVLRFMTDSEKPKTGFSFYSVINPAGSRNLEPGPAKVIKFQP